ncbi:MAG: hypothetical protein ACTSQY_02795 [Candidatus Odinarchaeia archaeon]
MNWKKKNKDTLEIVQVETITRQELDEERETIVKEIENLNRILADIDNKLFILDS